MGRARPKAAVRVTTSGEGWFRQGSEDFLQALVGGGAGLVKQDPHTTLSPQAGEGFLERRRIYYGWAKPGR